MLTAIACWDTAAGEMQQQVGKAWLLHLYVEPHLAVHTKLSQPSEL